MCRVLLLLLITTQDGARPCPRVRSNPEIMQMVCTQGGVHPRPSGCSARVHAEFVKCWDFDPSQRPEFSTLEMFFAGATAEATSDADAFGGIGAALASTPTSDGNEYLAPTRVGSLLPATDGTEYLAPTPVGSPALELGLSAKQAQPQAYAKETTGPTGRLRDAQL